MVADAFRRVAVFSTLSDASLAQLQTAAEAQSLKSGALLFSEGDQAGAVYLLQTGSLQVFRRTRDGDERVLARLEPGAVVGEQALREGRWGRRNASVRALTEVTLLALPAEALFALPEFASVAAAFTALGLEQTRAVLSAFSALGDALGVEAFALGTVQTFEAGALIFSAGVEDDAFYLVERGEVGLYEASGSTPRRLLTLGEGTGFGALAGPGLGPAEVSARAESPVAILRIEREALLARFGGEGALEATLAEFQGASATPQRGFVVRYGGELEGAPALTHLYQLPDGQEVLVTRALRSPALVARGQGLVADSESVFEAEGLVSTLSFAGDRLVSAALFHESVDSMAVLSALLDGTPVAPWQRALFERKGTLQLLRNEALGDDAEVLCPCTGTTRGQLRAAQAAGATSLEALVQRTGASAVCGGCKPRLAALAGSDQWRPVRCEALSYPAKDVVAMTLVPFAEPGEAAEFPTFQPGQHVVVQGLVGEDWIERPYTLASSAEDRQRLTLLVKQEPQGLFSNWARRQLEVGDLLRLGPPSGEACLPDQDGHRPVAAFVAGIGVTPALALAETFAHRDPRRPLRVFYCGRSAAELAGLERLKALQVAGLNLSLTLWETAGRGRPREADFAAFLQPIPEPFVFVCGPEGFDHALAPTLDALQVPEARRFLEVFTPQGARPEQALGPACPIPDGFKYQWPGSAGAPDQGPCPDAAQPAVGLVTVSDSLAVQAKSFLRQCYQELGAEDAFSARWARVAQAIEQTGSYEHTFDELLFGARLAWRNSARCVGRLFWNGLHLEDARHVADTDGMFEALKRHIALATQGGQLRAVMTAFRPQRPGEARGPRVWNSQLLRYAGYRKSDGSLLGDPANERMTVEALKRGWVPPTPKTGFDLLPLILEMPGAPPGLYEIPRELVLEVPLEHPEHAWFAELGLKWYALPAVSEVKLSLGGLNYTAAPFNGWYMGTEIGARNLSDPYRYNLLPRLAQRLGLPTHRPRTLWQDRALLELNIAVLHSFERAGVKLVDHHAATADFMQFAEQERAAGRQVAGRWSWLVPPISGSATPTFHYEWEEHTVLPQYFYQAEPWEA